jgi:hypothetical protein
MKSVFFFILLLAPVMLFAQDRSLVLTEVYGQDTIHTEKIKKGDDIRLYWSDSGKNKKTDGPVLAITENTIVIGTDTIRTEMIKKIGIKVSRKKRNTKRIIAAGLGAIAVVSCSFVVYDLYTLELPGNSGLVAFVAGIITLPASAIVLGSSCMKYKMYDLSLNSSLSLTR